MKTMNFETWLVVTTSVIFIQQLLDEMRKSIPHLTQMQINSDYALLCSMERLIDIAISEMKRTGLLK